MERSDSWTDADNVGLTDEATPEEVDRFLSPLEQHVPIRHVGWSNFDPVFKPTSGATVTEVRSAIVSLLDNARIRSAGHRAYVLEPDATATKPNPANTALLLKVEDWMTGCIPNTHHDDTAARESYIAEREAEIADREQSWLSGRGTVVVDRHVSSGGRYGQYQFLAVLD